MGAKVLMSVEEYLSTGFGDREPEYVDGEVVERSMPTYPHSKAQREMIRRFGSFQETSRLFACPELRVRVAPQQYRIPDLAVYAGTEPTDAVPSAPPLVVAEIVSPDDRHADIIKRLREYRAWGVPHVWLIDPVVGQISVYSESGLATVSALELPEYGLRITREELLS